MDFIHRNHVQVIPDRYGNLVVVDSPHRRLRRTHHRVYSCRIQRLIRIGFSIYVRSMDLCWVEHNGNLYGLEKWQHYTYLPANYHKLWIFNLAARKWKLKYLVNDDANERLCLGVNFMVTYGDRFICNVNGEHIYSCELTNDTEYRLRKERVSSINFSQVPNMQKTSTIRIGDFIYAVGGLRLNQPVEMFPHHADVYRLSLSTLTWECLFESSHQYLGFIAHALAHNGTSIFVLGGLNAGNGSDLDFKEIHIFDLRRFTWKSCRHWLPDSKHGFPTPRRAICASQQISNSGEYEVYIVGGVSNVYQCYDFWKLNLSTGQWTCLYGELRNHYYTSIALDNGALCVFGSSLIDSQLGTVMKMWMRVPTLLDMCWDVVTSINPHLNTYDRQRLIAEGIPRQCLKHLCHAESSDMIYTY